MNVNILSIEKTIDKTIKELSELKGKNNIEKIEINIRKYWMDGYYDTDFKVDYNIGGEEWKPPKYPSTAGTVVKDFI